MPLYSIEKIVVQKSFLDNINPAKKMEEINKFIKKLKKFDENSSFKDLSDFMKFFKKFTEKELGREISINELLLEINKQMYALKIPVHPDVIKSCLTKLLKKEKNKHKSLITHNGTDLEKEEFAGAGHIALGCVCLACAVLVGAIGYAVPPFAAHCTQLLTR
jgi:hypothetical protein